MSEHFVKHIIELNKHVVEVQNLLQETLVVLKNNNKTTKDVLFISDGKHSCSWEEFAKKACDFNYYNGHGTINVNLNLVIVGKDWWLERYEYDGLEQWVYKSKPQETDPNDEIILDFQKYIEKYRK